MLAATAKTKRFFEITQFVLSLASTCAVVEASRVPAAVAERPGYHTSVPQPRDAASDRSIADLARAERKRREAEQHASRRGLELGHTLQQSRRLA